MVHRIWDSMPEVQQELHKVKHIMVSELHIHIPDVAAKIKEYMDAPGKYLRAGLCLAMAQLTPEGITEQKRYTAAALEVLHLATLIHDDVIDEADSRRGIETMHVQTNNRIAIYAGDYLMAYFMRLMQKGMGHLDSNPLDAWVMEGILVGELNQLANQFRYDMTIYDYLRQIRGKTALLFASATFFGYYSLSQSALKNRQAYYFGQAIGMAFQLTDDLIDYQVEAKQSGKPRMQDVQNGIYTAPLILAMNERPAIREQLKARQANWSETELEQLYQQMQEMAIFERTNELVDNYMKKATKRLKGMGSKEKVEPILNLLSQTMQRNY